MKNKLIIIIGCLFSFLLTAIPVFAQELKNPIKLSDADNLPGLVASGITIVISFVGVIALVAFIYGGLLWMTSAGNENQIGKAKQVMVWAVFGIVAVFISYAVVTLILTSLGIGGS